MTLITRRTFLRGSGAGALSVGGLGAYAVGIEPELMLNVTSYTPQIANWPSDLPLRIAVIADIHACEPWMSAARVREICLTANDLKPDGDNFFSLTLVGVFNSLRKLFVLSCNRAFSSCLFIRGCIILVAITRTALLGSH